jgi:hypothetical protein
MKCLSCQLDIDPKWKHAIDNNVCPFCGDHIMPEDLKNNIVSLREIISSFKEKYSEQLDDLLFSNYNYVRIDSPRMKQFTPEPKIIYHQKHSNDEDPSHQEHESLSVQDQEVTSKFFKNAEVSKAVSRTNELKKLVTEIKSSNPNLKKIAHSSPVMTADELASEMEEDFESPMPHYQNSDDDIPAAVLAFTNQKNNKDPNYNMRDVLKLQQLQQRTVHSRDNVINGTGGKGSFSRSG